MAEKKLLAILGSPRAGGNVAQMLGCAVQAAREAGWQAEVVNLYEQNIGWCRGCMACKQAGACAVKDDIAPLLERLAACDVVALAAPTYFANVPAAVKNMFDRLVGAVMDDNKSPLPKPRLSRRQKYLLLTACNTPPPFDRLCGQSSGALRAMREFFRISGMGQLGQVVFAGTRGKASPPARIQNKIRGYWQK